MGIITRMRRQKAVYWAPRRPGDFSEEAYELPVEIACRWEDKEVWLRDERGNQTLYQSTVYVDRDLAKGGRLQLTTLAALESSEPTIQARYVKRFNKTPKLNLRETLRVAYLG